MFERARTIGLTVALIAATATGTARADAPAEDAVARTPKARKARPARHKAATHETSPAEKQAQEALEKANAALAKAQEALAAARNAAGAAQAASGQAAHAQASSSTAVKEVDSLKATLLPAPRPPNAKPEPFAFGDFTWVNGNSRQTDFPLDGKIFSGELRVDTVYTCAFNHPKDHSLVGSTNTLRADEFQVSQFGVGGDFHYNNVRGRLLTQLGLYSTSQPRNDPSSAVGQWQLDTAYRYVSEAYGGYHLDKWNGINVDIGIFMSYIGLFSYYNFDNWAYQMSYVSANTPWYFNGMRIQTFPTDRLKIEYWLVNGWQSYGKFSSGPGVGIQATYRPTEDWSFMTSDYFGHDTLGIGKRDRWHTDNSILHRYYKQKNKKRGVTQAAFSLTLDAGAENGGGVSGFKDDDPFAPQQYFLGFMFYNRVWFHQDKFAFTVGGGSIHNPGRYLVLVPAINAATAASGAAPFFTANPGDDFKAWDGSIGLDYMPNQNLTHRLELVHREANVPYFAGSGGITPQVASGVFENTGTPGSAATNFDGTPFVPDLRNHETRINYALLVKM